MTTIKILTIDNEYIDIELANTSGAKIWLDHMVHQGKEGTLKHVAHPSKLPPDPDRYNPIWNNIKKNIALIENRFNIKWPESIPEVFPHPGSDFMPFDRQLLNRFHRYFAQSTMMFNRWQVNSTTTFNPIPENDRNTFVELLEEINVWIHQIEIYCDSINDNAYQGKIKKLELKFDDLVWRGNDWEKFFDHSLNPEYNVCISMEVHGKNYLQAFLDDDDPTQIDVHGIQGLYGCLDIYLDDTVFKILESDEFKKWLGTTCIKDAGLVQIGKVISSSKPIGHFYFTRTFDMQLSITE